MDQTRALYERETRIDPVAFRPTTTKEVRTKLKEDADVIKTGPNEVTNTRFIQAEGDNL